MKVKQTHSLPLLLRALTWQSGGFLLFLDVDEENPNKGDCSPDGILLAQARMVSTKRSVSGLHCGLVVSEEGRTLARLNSEAATKPLGYTTFSNTTVEGTVFPASSPWASLFKGTYSKCQSHCQP